MTYTRPASSQLDLWPSLGLELNWETLLSFAKKGEHFQTPSANLTALGGSFDASAHGFSGPLATCISPHMTTGNIHETFNATFKALGISPRDEFNDGELDGFGVQQVTQDGLADVREDAARAYYYPLMNRTNLKVFVNTTATRVLWIPTNSNGSLTAAAAEVVSQNGTISTVFASREIILSAGAFRSPAILENSGVGNPSILSKQSIDLKINLPAVGENLQDQTTLPVTAKLINQNITGFPPFVAYVSFESLFGSNASSVYNSTLAKLPQYAAAIASQNGGASTAAVQQQLLKSQLDLLFESNTPASELAPIGLGDTVAIVFWPLQPFSRGSVHINDTDMTAQPAISPNFFQFDFDGQMAAQTSRFVRKFLMTEPLSSIVNASTIAPGLDVVPEDASDDVWEDWIQTKSAYQPNYHHLGTCAMLPRSKGGVVDNSFRVYGTKNVRVVDLSVVPLQVAGHSTALLYGIAEYAAQKIKDGS
jgi:choline dehydrogenase-like flavoprotein